MSLTPDEMREELIRKYPGKDIFYRNFGYGIGYEIDIMPPGGLKERNALIDREKERLKAQLAKRGLDFEVFLKNARKAWGSPDHAASDSYIIVIEAETS